MADYASANIALCEALVFVHWLTAQWAIIITWSLMSVMSIVLIVDISTFLSFVCN